MKEIIIKKPHQKRSWQKYDAVLDVLPRVLQEQGFKKTTAARLALEADISIGSFYDYFSCKEAAFIAFIDRRLDQALAEVMFKAANQRTTAEESLRDFINVGVDFAFEHSAIVKLLITEMPYAMTALHFTETLERFFEIAALFSKSKGFSLPDKDTQMAIYTLSSIVMGFQMRIVLMPDEIKDRSLIVDEIYQVLYGYMFDRLVLSIDA